MKQKTPDIMHFRYREMLYRPEYYDFHNEDREEWFPNGIFHYNVSRLIRDLDANETGKGTEAPWMNTAIKTSIPVEEYIDHYSFGLGNMEEEHIQAADLGRPLIFVELAPDCFNLIDGHHRLEKARRQGVSELSTWMVDAHAGVRYLESEDEYCRFVGYWNTKIEDIRDQAAYRGVFSPYPAPLVKRDLTGMHNVSINTIRMDIEILHWND